MRAARLVALCLAVPSALHAAPVITSRVQLAAYLHETPLAQTPLAAFSPGARMRFLYSLGDGPQPLQIVDYGDVRAELTKSQIDAVSALFGQRAPDIPGFGVTPEKRAVLEREWADAAQSRHCAPESCGETEIDRRYARLLAVEAGPAPADEAARFARNKRAYDRLFGHWQSHSALKTVSAPDLRLLARAVDDALFFAPDMRHLAILQAALAEMQRRGMADDADFQTLYGYEVALRMFGQAEALFRAHPGVAPAPLPRFIDNAGPVPRGPSVLAVDVAADTMSRKPISLEGQTRIVVIVGCHFSEDAARAIGGDAVLAGLFTQGATWLAEPGAAIGDVAVWDRQFPRFPMVIAWSQADWPMIRSWAMPTYYVFHDGRLTGQFHGWHGVDALKAELHRTGIL